jgi:hypothetical protein
MPESASSRWPDARSGERKLVLGGIYQRPARPMSIRKLDFIIAGTQKGGTTALDAYLREHQGIAMAMRKEIHFFDDEARFSAGGQPDYGWYEGFHDGAPAHALRGEATPIYMYWRPAPARIHAYNPDMKLIIILRNPITRAFSHWNMERARGADRESFWVALSCEAMRCKEAAPLQHRVYSYVDRGFYTRQLAHVWASIPKSQTLVLRHESLKHDVQGTLDAVCDFLGIERMLVQQRKNVHSLSYPSVMTRREWIFLANTFEQEILALERLLGWDCRDWLIMPKEPLIIPPS